MAMTLLIGVGVFFVLLGIVAVIIGEKQVKRLRHIKRSQK